MPRAVIADDEPSMRETLRDVFEPYFETVVADSGEAAIEVVQHEPVHLALFDLNMHELSGLDTIRIVKAKLEIVPCILMTANWCDDLVAEAEAVQAFCVLRKPIPRRSLLGTMATAIEHTYRDAELRRRLLAG